MDEILNKYFKNVCKFSLFLFPLVHIHGLCKMPSICFLTVKSSFRSFMLLPKCSAINY